MRLSPRLVCRSTGSTFDASDQNNEGRVKRRLQRPPLTVGSLVTLTGKSFLGRGPGVPCLRKTSSFLARVLFYGPCARISGSGSPGSSDAAGAPGSPREDNPGLRTHVLGAPKVCAAYGALVGTPSRGKHRSAERTSCAKCVFPRRRGKTLNNPQCSREQGGALGANCAQR